MALLVAVQKCIVLPAKSALMKKVFTVGVFDYFHIGHLRLFENAKKYGDYLIVAVQDGDFILKYKPEANILYSTQQRIELVQALKIVDEVVVYKNVDDIIKQIDFDVWAIGGDQTHAGFQRALDWCRDNGKTVVRLPRTQGISSSQIKNELEKLR